jgi:hypothetical protein
MALLTHVDETVCHQGKRASLKNTNQFDLLVINKGVAPVLTLY